MKEVEVPSAEPIIAMVQGQLTTSKRWFYRGLLIASMTLVAVISSLWLTEPRPLPTRLHVAFAVSVLIGCGWIGVFTWLLWRRNTVSIAEQLVTSWASAIASGSFLAVALPIAMLRGTISAVLGLSLTGLLMLSISLFLLWKAYRTQAVLKQRLTELQGASRGGE